jgi:phospholipid/cholesterol/gamma-HCH transport system substrate-binding protein
MERHAHYALVGAASVAIIIAAFVFVVWLGNAQFSRQYDEYRIIFSGPVRGLSEGGDVQFNGIKVGQITNIALDQRDPNKVITDVQLNGGTPIRVDSTATTETQGISGVNIVQISAGTPALALLKEASHARRPLIRSKPNALSSILQGGGQMIQNASEALNRVNRLFSNDNLADLTASVHNVRLTTDELAKNRRMLDDAASMLARLDAASDDVQATAHGARSLVVGNGKQAVGDLASAAAELKLAVHDARGTLAKLDAGSDTVAKTTLPNINATMLSLQETADELNGFIRQLREDPRGTLGKSRGKEVELPQ